jgi:hypothetical protein
MTVPPTCPYPRLRWPDKVATLATWGCAIAVFATVGWMAISPADPRGVVRITAGSWPLILTLVALAGVVAGLSTAAIGRKLPDAGTFAVAVGLAAANLKGQSVENLLMVIEEPGPRRILCLEFTVEAVIWFAILLVAMISSGVVMRWCFGRGEPDPLCNARLSAMCIADMPGLRRLAGGPPEAGGSARLRVSLMHGLVVIALALVLVRVLAAGSTSPKIRQEQVYFAIAVAFYLGSYAAHRWFPVQTPFPGCLTVLVVCIIGYLWTLVRIQGQGPYAELAGVPPTAFLRALPLEYVAVGTAGVLAAFWSRPSHAIAGERASEARTGPR